MPTPTIAILEGDGVGPELCAEARRTLELIRSTYSLSWEVASYPCGAAYWQATHEEWPAEAREFCANQADGILFGSVGLPGVELPTGGLAGIGVVFGLRQGLDLYASVRPVELMEGVPALPYRPGQVKIHLVREATEGLYSGLGSTFVRGPGPELATDVRLVTAHGSERVARFAFALANELRESGDARPVTCVDKSNVLTGCRLFRRTVTAVAKELDWSALKYAYVDNLALDVLKNPQDYSVCVTSNAFGDILADLLAFLEGGTGVAATGNYGERQAMFEPLHGPQAAKAGKGTANPVAIHRCLVMLLAFLARRYNNPVFEQASADLMQAVRTVLAAQQVRTPDLGGINSTSEMSLAIRTALVQALEGDSKEALGK